MVHNPLLGLVASQRGTSFPMQVKQLNMALANGLIVNIQGHFLLLKVAKDCKNVTNGEVTKVSEGDR